jgi:hypothetical protein
MDIAGVVERETGKPKYALHAFRRGRGLSPQVVQNYLGHSSIVMTMDVYSPPVPHRHARRSRSAHGAGAMGRQHLADAAARPLHRQPRTGMARCQPDCLACMILSGSKKKPQAVGRSGFGGRPSSLGFGPNSGGVGGDGEPPGFA